MKFFKHFWLNFCQAVTILLAIIYVIRLYVPAFPNQLFQSQKTEEVAIHQASPAPVVTTDIQNSAASYRLAAQTAMPAVVNIFTSKKSRRQHIPLLDDPFFRFFFGDQLKQFDQKRKPQTSLGSGVIVSDNGLILTNYHVVKGADQIEVALSDGRKLVASLIGSDPESDLSVLKIDASKLPVITFADIQGVAIGDAVLAIGNPFGVGQTVTQGIVSAMGRDKLGINTFENFIQTDASINPGNSGGALVNTLGQLIGINTAIYSKSGGSMGIGFAIPATLAQQVLEQIIQSGKVTRGWMGIEKTQDLTPALVESFGLESSEGVIITRLYLNSPAALAGLRPGDIILEINDQITLNGHTVTAQIASLTPDTNASVTVLRQNERLMIDVLVGTRPTKH